MLLHYKYLNYYYKLNYKSSSNSIVIISQEKFNPIWLIELHCLILARQSISRILLTWGHQQMKGVKKSKKKIEF